MASTLKHLNDQNFSQEISKGAVLVDFYADWCGPCRMMSPILETFAKEMEGKLTVAKLDIDVSPVTTQAYDVQSVPTLILFINGEVSKKIVGLKDLTALKRNIEPALAL